MIEEYKKLLGYYLSDIEFHLERCISELEYYRSRLIELGWDDIEIKKDGISAWKNRNLGIFTEEDKIYISTIESYPSEMLSSEEWYYINGMFIKAGIIYLLREEQKKNV